MSEGRIAGLGLGIRKTPVLRKLLEAQVDETVSEPPGGRDRSSRSIPAPDGTGAGASAGRLEADLQSLARACRNRHRDARRQVPFGAHTPVRVGSTARSAPFLFWRPRIAVRHGFSHHP